MNILQLFVMKVQEFVYSICFIAVNDAHRMKKIQLGKFKAERRKKMTGVIHSGKLTYQISALV